MPERHSLAEGEGSMIRACLVTGAVIGLIFCMLFAATAWGAL